MNELRPINKNLKKIRDKWDLSQREMAWLLNVSREMLNTYEVRNSKMKSDTVSKLSRYSGFTEERLEAELKEEEIPNIPTEVDDYIKKRNRNPEAYEGKGPPQLELEENDDSDSNIYKKKYLELLESRVLELEQDKKFLKQIIDTNSTLSVSLLRAIMNSQTAHDEVVMKALDRLLGNEAGTLSGEADNIEKEMNRNLNALQDVSSSTIGNRLGKV